MTEQVFNIIIALIFLLVGFYLGHPRKQRRSKKIKEAKKSLLTKTAVKAGILDYPTQEDIDYVESGEEKVDEAREKVFREQFTP